MNLSYEEQIRGTEFKYSSFLWKNVDIIRQAELAEKPAEALTAAITLIPYLPNGIKKKFKGRADEIEEDMQYLTKEVKERSTDLFSRGVVTNRVLQKYAKVALARFVDELCDELDKRGYMERVKRYRRGKFED